MTNLNEAIKQISHESVRNDISVKTVMSEAWYIAKLIASEYQVSSKALLSAALKRVWQEVRVRVEISNSYEKRASLAKIGFTFNETTKAWEKEMKRKESTGKQAVRFGKGFIKNFSELFIAKENIKISLVY